MNYLSRLEEIGDRVRQLGLGEPASVDEIRTKINKLREQRSIILGIPAVQGQANLLEECDARIRRYKSTLDRLSTDVAPNGYRPPPSLPPSPAFAPQPPLVSSSSRSSVSSSSSSSSPSNFLSPPSARALGRDDERGRAKEEKEVERGKGRGRSREDRREETRESFNKDGDRGGGGGRDSSRDRIALRSLRDVHREGSERESRGKSRDKSREKKTREVSRESSRREKSKSKRDHSKEDDRGRLRERGSESSLFAERSRETQAREPSRQKHSEETTVSRTQFLHPQRRDRSRQREGEGSRSHLERADSAAERQSVESSGSTTSSVPSWRSESVLSGSSLSSRSLDNERPEGVSKEKYEEKKREERASINNLHKKSATTTTDTNSTTNSNNNQPRKSTNNPTTTNTNKKAQEILLPETSVHSQTTENVLVHAQPDTPRNTTHKNNTTDKTTHTQTATVKREEAEGPRSSYSQKGRGRSPSGHEPRGSASTSASSSSGTSSSASSSSASANSVSSSSSGTSSSSSTPATSSSEHTQRRESPAHSVNGRAPRESEDRERGRNKLQESQTRRAHSERPRGRERSDRVVLEGGARGSTGRICDTDKGEDTQTAWDRKVRNWETETQDGQPEWERQDSNGSETTGRARSKDPDRFELSRSRRRCELTETVVHMSKVTDTTDESSSCSAASPKVGSPQSLTDPEYQSQSRHVKGKSQKWDPISKNHPHFELTHGMMLGIRTTVGKTQAKACSQLFSHHFTDTHPLKFPSKPSRSARTPGHEFGDFSFKDYAPEVFRRIRLRFGVDAMAYLISEHLPYLNFISNSKSGEFFFFSHDKQFMIKTITHHEAKTLRALLPKYYKHILANEDTLITRFYGLHRVEVDGIRTRLGTVKKVYFLIMGSVFYSQKIETIQLQFDLKGSLLGRRADKSKPGIWKDQDLLDQKIKIRIGKENAIRLNAQIAKDVQLLREMQIMDYSLLLGIHYPKTTEDGKLAPEANLPRRMERTDSIRLVDHPTDMQKFQKALLIPDPSGKPDVSVSKSSCPVREPSRHRQQSPSTRPDLSSMQSAQMMEASSADLSSRSSERSLPPGATRAKPELVDRAEVITAHSYWTRDDGGFQSHEVDPGTGTRPIYFFGIIDTLITYGPRKKLETRYKTHSKKADLWTVSAVDPTTYAERFKRYLANAIV